MPIRRAAFTLLEVCLALLIALTLVLLATPSIAGLLAEQRLNRAFQRFDRLVAEAKRRSVKEQRAWRLLWKDGDVVLAPVQQGAGAEGGAERLVRSDDETFALQRPAALQSPSPAEWIFWPNGTCEPVVISFTGQAGKWEARYDALTARGVFLASETR